MKPITPVLIALATLAMTACATLENASDRYLGSDASLIEAAVMVNAVRRANPDLDLDRFETRLLAYRAIDIVADARRERRAAEDAAAAGLISAEEAEARTDAAYEAARNRVRALLADIASGG